MIYCTKCGSKVKIKCPECGHDTARTQPSKDTVGKAVEMIPVSWAYELTNRFYGSDYNMSYKTFGNALEELRKKVADAKQAALQKGGGK